MASPFEALARRASQRACALAVTVLAGCGGGGGGETTPATTPADVIVGTPAPPTGTTVPTPAPGLPTVSYQGRSTSAVLTSANVGTMADAMYYAIGIGIDIAAVSHPRQLAVGNTSESFADEAGGTAQIIGYMSADGTGWYSVTTLNYAGTDGFTRSGMIVDEILQTSATQGWFSRRLSYHEQAVTNGEREANYSGHLTLTRSAEDAMSVSGTIRIRAGAAELMVSDLALSLKTTVDGTELSASGRVFDSTYGWVDFSLQTPWLLETDTRVPASGGPLIGTTQDGRALRIVSLKPDGASLQYTAVAPGRFDRAARVAWSPSFWAQTSRAPVSTPVADAGPSTAVSPGSRLPLQGAYSSHAESAFLSYKWKLLFRPPGSTAQLSDASAVNPDITLDATGRYLLELVVSDGVRSSTRDFVAVSADARVATPVSDAIAYQLPASTVATLGSTVPTSGEVWGPHGDTVPMTTVGTQLAFVASEPGVYKVVLGDMPTVVNGFDTQFIRVLADVNFTPAVWVPATDFPRHLVAADLDGDGRSDLVASEATQLEIFFSAAPPDMRGPLVLAGTQGEPVAVGDLTGDGRADIATGTSTGVAVFSQDADGLSFGPANVLPSSCVSDKPIAIADINGDGHNDVAFGCRSIILYHLGRSDGTLDMVRSITADVETELAANDLNDDGFDDLVITKQHNQNIGIVYGQAGTAPQPVQSLTIVAQSHDRTPQVAIADLNGDGRQDLAFGGRAFGPNLEHDKVRVFHQDAAGQFVEAQVFDLPYPRRALDDVTVADFNHDGKIDIGVRTVMPTFLVHHQITPGTFSEQSGAALDCNNRTPADYNGDGLIDVACVLSSTWRTGVGIMFGTLPAP